ncbi:hypothetical protein BDZ94DRAFT_866204 [Collybia nuda]|uniref:F-box domain-containing protein n=1 Tax=Collybia nuda TaxID=64659 RepID=A0A9P6CHG1_9AGAR|nr:hypothetical protein BDZ94DRAFT_866204 [Collybia nuda]
MPLLSPSATQQKREVLLTEEKHLADALSDIRTALNDLTAVASLPTEILEEVFGICVSWLYGHQKPKYRLAWTQVCRTWRRISFNSARLWHCIDLCDSRLAHEFLIRSKTAPISIVSASPLKLCTENLQPHANRLQAIDVFLFPDDMVSLFDSIGPNLSSLTHMSLRIPPVSSNLILEIDVSNVTRLMLDCVAIPWDTCGGLTYMSLRGLPTEYAPSLPQLFTIFKSSPDLEYVKLECIAPALADDHPPTDSISLPKLRELVISGKPPLIHTLLSGLILPISARLQFNCPTFDDLNAFLPADQHWRRPEISTLRLSRRAANFIQVGAASWSDEHLDSLISLSSSSPTNNIILSGLTSILDLSHITTIELSSGALFELQPNFVWEFLTQTMNLNCLRIAPHYNLDELFHVLTPLLPPSDSGHVCPHLTTISFGKPGEMWGDFGDLWLKPLFALAKARHTNSVPFSLVEFKQCKLNQNTVELFDGIVAGVSICEQLNIPPSRRSIFG